MYIAENKYYSICLDFDFQKLFIVWISGETDTAMVDDSNHKIMAFKSKEDLKCCAQLSGFELIGEQANYNIRKLKQWLLDPDDNFICEDYLNFWNLCIDVGESVNGDFIGNSHYPVRDILYNKLYDGGGPFIAQEPNPEFNSMEIKELSNILQNGLSLLLDNLLFYNDKGFDCSPVC